MNYRFYEELNLERNIYYLFDFALFLANTIILIKTSPSQYVNFYVNHYSKIKLNS